MHQTLLLGQTLRFETNPFGLDLPGDAVHVERRGGVLIEDGLIAATGPADTLKALHPQAQRIDHGSNLILAGFIDAHAHFSQTAIIASWGSRLIEWLNTYTFPEEARFFDPAYCAEIASRYLDLNIANGTTTACCYTTIHPASCDALFAEALSRDMRLVAGKVMMDRNAPDTLRDTAQSGYDDSAALISKWRGKGRIGYAVSPRFAPTSSPEQLEAAGALWAENPDCLMQTHLSEQHEEIAWVHELYPDHEDYFAVYQHYGLTGPGAIMGHSIHLKDREWAAIAETGTGMAHCPTSNTFIGSGLFRATHAASLSIPTGLATDVGGGSSFSMLRTMAAAYEVSQLAGAILHPAHLLWLATMGAAETMCLGEKIGNLVPGREADIVVLDLASTPVIEQRAANANSFWETVFPTIMLGDDRAIAAVYLNGKKA